MEISYTKYKKALETLEVLLSKIDDNTPKESPEMINLIIASNIIEAYEEEHYPIGDDENNSSSPG